MSKRKYSPRLDNMVEVTPSNRKSLEKKYSISIPEDVEWILPPQLLTEMLNNPESWEEASSG